MPAAAEGLCQGAGYVPASAGCQTWAAGGRLPSAGVTGCTGGDGEWGVLGAEVLGAQGCWVQGYWGYRVRGVLHAEVLGAQGCWVQGWLGCRLQGYRGCRHARDAGGVGWGGCRAEGSRVQGVGVQGAVLQGLQKSWGTEGAGV